MIFRHGRRVGGYFCPSVRAFLAGGLLCALNVIAAGPSVSLAWDPSPDGTVTGYKIYYGQASRAYTQQVSVGNVTNTTIAGLIAGAGYYFTATAHDDTGLESDYCNEVFYQVPVDSPNQVPTLNLIADVALKQNSGMINVQLSGISAGSGETGQPISVTASSSHPAIVPAPSVSYFAPNTWAMLTLGPAAGAVGTATITVTVNDGQPANNTLVRTFQVAVTAGNTPPTMNLPANLSLQENAGGQTVLLTGISAGADGENQTVTITAASSNTQLIPHPTVQYTSLSSTGTLLFTPVANASGSATITVTLNDGQSTDNLITRSFTVYVSPVNQPPTLNPLNNVAVADDAGPQIVQLSGITSGALNEIETLVVSAVSSAPTIVPHPVVSYTSPASTGTLTFTPVAGAAGSATITVTVNDGQAADNLTTRTFVVTVSSASGNKPPTLDVINDLTIADTGGMQAVQLTGITSGSATENQFLFLTAVSSHPGIVPNPNVSYSSPNSSGSLWFTPVSGASGTATITVTVYDSQDVNNSITRTFVVTVVSPNRAPTLDQIANATVPENSKDYPVQLTGITPGSAQESQQVTLTATSSNPSLVPNPTITYTPPSTTGTLFITPTEYASGNAIITVTANDGQATNNICTRIFLVRVDAVNQAPTLNEIADLTLPENASMQTVPLSGITSGAPNENQTLLVTAVSSNPSVVPNPSVNYTSPNATGTLSFTPVPSAYGTAVITVTVSDGQASDSSIVRTFSVRVGSENRPPTLAVIPDLNITESAGVQTVALSGIGPGAETETQPLTITAVSSNPELVPNPTVNYSSPATSGTLSFKPTAEAFGSATITVTVNDGQSSNSQVTRVFTVNVAPVNQPPTLNPIANLSLNENAPAQMVTLTGITSGSVYENQTVVISAVSSNPSVVPNPSVNYTSPNTTGTLSIAPVPSAFGSAMITVTVSDGQASNSSMVRTFAVNVAGDNRPPTLGLLPDLNLSESAGLQTVALSGIGAGADHEVQPLTITAVSSNPALVPNPTVNYSSPATSGTLSFKPTAEAFGSATITVTVNDGQSSNSQVTRVFTVNVAPVNQRPTLNPIANLSLEENAPAQTVTLTGITSGSVYETQALFLTAISSNPSLIPNPSVNYNSPSGTGTLSFTPVPGAHGTATITVTVDDGQDSDSSIARTFQVNVAWDNRPPTLALIPDLNITESAGLQTVTLSGITAGAVQEVQPLTITAVSSNPTLVPHPTVNYTSPASSGTLTFKPAAEAFGSAAITVTVHDGQPSNNQVTRVFTVQVAAVNQPPTLNPIANLDLEENAPAQTVTLTGITSGSIYESQTLTLTATSSNPALIPNPQVQYSSPGTTGTLSFTPAAGASGTALITVCVNDGQIDANTVVRAFEVTVKAANRAPTLNPLAPLVMSENAGLQTVALTGISCGDSDASQPLVVTAISSNPSLIPNPFVAYSSPGVSGSVTFTPAAYAHGTATITVTVNDGQAVNSSVSRSFLVTVESVNQAPTLNPIADVTVPENAPTQILNLSGITSGAANEADPLTITALSGDATLIPHPTVSYISPATSGTLSFKPVAGASGSTTITVRVTDGQSTNNTFARVFRVVVTPVNHPPTLDPLNSVTLPADGTPQFLNLSGITAGSTNENQVLTVSATSSDTKIVAQPVVTYTSPQQGGLLRLAAVQNATGAATVTVTVSDGQPVNAIFSRSFTVTVASTSTGPNQRPTLHTIPSISILENSGPQTVLLTGISAGGPGENQVLTVTASSSNPNIIPHPTVSYTTPNAQGTLGFNPTANAYGSATITVTVNDGQSVSNSVSRAFIVSVTPVNSPPTINPIADLALPMNSGTRSVQLSGITSGAANELQSLSVAATSSNPNLIPSPAVNYRSGNSIGSLTLAPVPNSTGIAVISVLVNDGQASNNVTRREFTVSIVGPNNPPTLDPVNGRIIWVNSAPVSIPLSGIGAGGESQLVTLRAESSSPEIVPDPLVAYQGGTTARLILTPAANTQGQTTISVTADDGQAVSNSVRRSFLVVVGQPDIALVLGSAPVTAGQIARLPLDVYSDLNLTNVSLSVQVPPGRFTSFALEDLAPWVDPASARITQLSQSAFEIRFATYPGQTFPSYCTAAHLALHAEADQAPATVALLLQDVAFTTSSGLIAAEVPVLNGQITITGPQAQVEKTLANGSANLTLRGRQGASYQIEYSTDGTHWTLASRVAATSSSLSLPIGNAPAGAAFRAVEFTADPPIIEAQVAPGQARRLLIYGVPAARYTVEYTTDPGPNPQWHPLSNRALTDSFLHQDVPDLGAFSLFRVKKN